MINSYHTFRIFFFQVKLLQVISIECRCRFYGTQMKSSRSEMEGKITQYNVVKLLFGY